MPSELNPEKNVNCLTIGDGTLHQTVDVFIDRERVYFHVPGEVCLVDIDSAQTIINFLSEGIRQSIDVKNRSDYYASIIASDS